MVLICGGTIKIDTRINFERWLSAERGSMPIDQGNERGEETAPSPLAGPRLTSKTLLGHSWPVLRDSKADALVFGKSAEIEENSLSWNGGLLHT